jgi:ribosomal protein L11 methylase PrmA
LALPDDQPSFILDLGCGSGDSIDLTYTQTAALELLALPDDQPSFILDLGCGSGAIIDITYGT